MGIFDDGYLGAVVSGIGSEQKQQQLLMFDISSTSDQLSLIRAESSPSPLGFSEAADTILAESPPEMYTKTAFLDPPRAQEIDIHEILESTRHQLSPLFIMEGSHSPSSAKQVTQKIMTARLENSAKSESQLSSDSLIPDTVADHSNQKQEFSVLPTFSESVSSSDSVLSSITWASPPKTQKDDPAKESDSAAPSGLRKESPLPNYDQSIHSKQQGSKRRKGQQKHVVCVPLTGGGNSSEIIPSDMWAWRKYGQKPIKGSPYPRGYYRCSSSKGCSARKQVERSRTDPSMLVVTYTSEHNHAWPAHRNSLAGTTRSKSLDRPRSINTEAATAAVAAVANSNTFSDQANLQMQESSLVSSAAELSAIGEAAFILEDDDNPLVLDNNVSSSQDQQLFQDFEELPELTAFMHESFFSYKSAFDDTGSMGVDPYDLFYWPSSSCLGSEIAGI